VVRNYACHILWNGQSTTYLYLGIIMTGFQGKKMMAQSRIVELIEDGEDLILPLGDEIFDELGWQVGDTVNWSDNGDGSWTVRKVL
jgi:hypothetical protein